MRPVSCEYSDPLDTIWLSLAERFGIEVARSDSAFASSDGLGTLTIATSAELDRDDCLAQMIFHELCHAICQGEGSFEAVDWGLHCEGQISLEEERACLRLQHALASRYGLERVLAPTTEHRIFYDALGGPSFGNDAASVQAQRALTRASAPPFFPHLDRALERTAEVAGVISGLTADAGDASTALLARVRPKPDSGFDCAECGACCREAFDVVEIDETDPFVELHAELCVRRENRIELRRPEGRCRALQVVQGRHRCSVHPTRPQTCRDFTRGSVNCREARLKVGLPIAKPLNLFS